LHKSKLLPRADGPFKVVERINDNVYKLDVPADFGVSPTFNIADLKPYLREEDDLESRTTQMQEGEDDEDIPANDTSPTSTSSLPQQDSIPLAGPITHARARQLNNQVSSLLSSYTPCLDCGNTCTIGLLRNHGEERLGKGFGSAGFGLQHNTNF
jgi:hypothetical protein